MRCYPRQSDITTVLLRRPDSIKDEGGSHDIQRRYLEVAALHIGNEKTCRPNTSREGRWLRTCGQVKMAVGRRDRPSVVTARPPGARASDMVVFPSLQLTPGPFIKVLLASGFRQTIADPSLLS